MSIWYHNSYREWNIEPDVAFRGNCLYCTTPIRRDHGDEALSTLDDELNYGFSDKFTTRGHAVIGICPACGWWMYANQLLIGGCEPARFDFRAAVLKRLDFNDVSIPLQEVRNYLTAKYEGRFDVHPRVFESVVASVFGDHEYETQVTSYSGDGGIDVILGKGASTIGVQVKRYKEENRISVAQIRELTGALVIAGHTKGIFVTTSEFQAGAEATANASAERGYPITLIDAPRFYNALKIAQLSSTREVANRKPWGKIASTWGT